MSNIYERGRALAIRQLAPIAQGGKGQVVTLTWQAAGERGASQPPPVSQICSGIEKNYDARRIDGTNILSGDSAFVLSPVATSGDDVATHDGEDGTFTLTLASGAEKSVVRVQASRPSGLLISVELQLRDAG